MRLSAWKVPVEHLSASSISMLITCPELYRLRKIKKLPESRGLDKFIGTVDHSTWEKNFKQKIDSGEDYPEGDLFITYAQEWDEEIKNDGEPDWTKPPEEVFDHGQLMVKTYLEQVAPTIQPVAVEARFEETIPDVPIPIIGYIDIQEQERLIERKTTKTKLSKPKPQWLLQGRLYHLASGLPVEWQVVTRQKTPAVCTPQTDPGLRMEHANNDATLQLVQQTAHLLNDYWTRYGPDNPWPLHGLLHPFQCGYCVPTDNSEILTRSGWKQHDEVNVGDETLGLLPTGQLGWTKITNVIHPGKQDVVLIKKGSEKRQFWQAESTLDHKWVNSYGEYTSTREFPVTSTRRENRIIVAAPLQDRDETNARPDDHALIGWLVCDGSFRTSGKGHSVLARIYQAKYVGRVAIEKLLQGIPHRTHYPPSKHTSGLRGYYIRTSYAWYLWHLLGLERRSPTDYVLSLTPGELKAFVDACSLAEGDGETYISQNDGEWQEAMALAVYLRGNRPNISGKTKCKRIRFCSPTLGMRRMKVSPTRTTEVWCVETALGTWTMKQNNQIMLTGNCSFGPAYGSNCIAWTKGTP